jgi:antitoxin ParD1/3/4
MGMFEDEIMSLQLRPELQKFIDDQVQAGHYDSPEEVIEAGLSVLRQQDAQSDFAEGELDKLLAAGEADLERGDTHDGETVFREIDELSATRRRERSK